MTKARKWWLWMVMLAGALLGTAGAVRAQVDDLLPADALVVLKVHGPYHQYERLRDSRLMERLKDPQTMPELAHALAQLEAAVRQVEQQHNVDVERMAADALAGQAALVICGKAKGAVLVEGRTRSALEKTAQQFVRIQRQGGGIRGTEIKMYGGVKVHHLRVGQEGEDQLYAVLGKVLVATPAHNADLMRRIIDIYAGDAAPLAENPRYRGALALVDDEAVASAYVDVPGFLALAPKPPNPLAVFIADWIRENVDYAVMSVTARSGVRGRVTVKYTGDELPEFFRSVLPPQGSRLKVLDLVPRSAAIAGARAVDLEALWEGLLTMAEQANPRAPARMRQALQNVVDSIGGVHSAEQLFDELGDQMALFVHQSDEEDGPPQVGFVLALNETAHIPVALETLMGAIVSGMRAGERGNPRVTLDHDTYRGVRMSVIRIDRPDTLGKLSPTLCQVDGHLVVASTAAAARKVVDASKGEGTRVPRAPGTLSRASTVNVRKVRNMLRQYSSFLMKHASQPEGKVRRDLGRLDTLLSLLDRVVYTESYRSGRTDHILRIDLSAEAR